MAGEQLPSHGPITGINVTPFVDIALVLLVIFIVTAKIIVVPAIPLDLPRASGTEHVQVVLSVIVPERGPLTIDGVAAEQPETFARIVRDAAREQPQLRAVVHAQASVPHQRVMTVLDRLRRAGLTRIAFGAQPLVVEEHP